MHMAQVPGILATVVVDVSRTSDVIVCSLS